MKIKKTYIIPESLTIVFSPVRMIAESPTLPLDDDDETEDPDEWLTKGNTSIWNEGW